MEKKASKVIEGEALDLIFGSRPLAGEEKEAVKAGVMKLLAEQYGIEEEDFLSAELEVVPAGKAREAGLDRSMVLGYGQDAEYAHLLLWQRCWKLVRRSAPHAASW